MVNATGKNLIPWRFLPCVVQSWRLFLEEKLFFSFFVFVFSYFLSVEGIKFSKTNRYRAAGWVACTETLPIFPNWLASERASRRAAATKRFAVPNNDPCKLRQPISIADFSDARAFDVSPRSARSLFFLGIEKKKVLSGVGGSFSSYG